MSTSYIALDYFDLGLAALLVALNGALFALWARQRRRLGMAQPLWRGSEWKL